MEIVFKAVEGRREHLSSLIYADILKTIRAEISDD
jgi:hypothetical protein